MLKNYFKIAIRSLMKYKVFSFINVFGLAVGIACCLLIAAFVFDELSYDEYPVDKNRIYRVEINNDNGNGGIDVYPNVDVAVGAGMKNSYPEVRSFTRLLPQSELYVKYDNKQFKEQHITFADSNFLQMFSLPLSEGDAKTALLEPNSIIITRPFAEKYFGKEAAMGKSLIAGRETYKVTGIMEDIPDNSHFHFDAVMSMASLHLTHNTWSNIGFYTYLLLNEQASTKKLESQFPELVRKYVVQETMHDMGVSYAEALKTVNTFKFYLKPLKEIHLRSNTKYELEANGDISYVYIFGALAIFILILAGVNFTNLSTASAAKRAREVGVRKVLGSPKKQLILQFLAESTLLTFIAVLIAFMGIYLLLPYFNQLAGKSINFNFFLTPKSLLAVLFLSLITGFLAGVYPAFFLSSFNVISVLKSKGLTSTTRKSLLRSGLVVFQFAVSTGLIIATMVVYRQLRFMQDKKLGYDKEQIVYLQNTALLGNRNVRAAFKQQLVQDTRIVSASIGTDIPGNPFIDGTQAYGRDRNLNHKSSEIHINIFHVDYDYIPTMGLQVIRGRNFSEEFSMDSSAVIINEAAVRELGWSGTNPLGNVIIRSGRQEYTVIGVVADFHYASVKQKIAPLMIMAGDMRSGLIVKIKTNDAKNLLGDIKQEWDKVNPGAEFNYYFLDDKFGALYKAEQKTGQIFSVFAAIAILVASMGLFGLATFITGQRTREIGIRKVFGASVQKLFILVSKEFLFLIVLSFAIAVPLAWWGMHTWLQDFAYRVRIDWSIFVLSGFIVLLIALATVSFHAIKAALANPVKSLRSE